MYKNNNTSIIKKTITTAFLIITTSINLKAQNTYYVATNGNDSNDGTTISTPWKTITYAASSQSSVAPGDTVFIKAGNYGNENVVFEIDGTVNNPITFEGYQFVPGDNPNLEWEYGDSLNPNIMPLLDGGDRTTGAGIILHNRKYVNINNIQITNYITGLYAWKGSYIKINNIIATSFGDQNENYSGKGIVFGSFASNNTIENCVVYNACAEGLSVLGDNHLINNCRVYADDDSTGHKSAMDYYIHINGNNNIIRDCYVERIGDITHPGHGIDLKGNCENNIISNCTAKGMALNGYELRHRGVKFNTIENCIAINCGYTIRDGASNNTIRNSKSINADHAIIFLDTSEDEGAQYTGRYNVFENCIFQDTQLNVINFFHYSSAELSVCDNNTFINCLFDGGQYLFNSDRENIDNKMSNCIVTNVQNYSESIFNPAYPVDFNFEFTNFWNNGFTIPTGLNVFEFNPGFVDLVNNDYHLTPSSLCIDVGSSIDAPITDFDGNPRALGDSVDIGPFEYSSTLSVDQLNSINQTLIYPNPMKNWLNIKGTEFDLTEIKFYNLLGQDVTKLININIKNKTSAVIDVTNLSSGLYIVKTKTTANKIYKSLIIN